MALRLLPHAQHDQRVLLHPVRSTKIGVILMTDQKQIVYKQNHSRTLLQMEADAADVAQLMLQGYSYEQIAGWMSKKRPYRVSRWKIGRASCRERV